MEGTHSPTALPICPTIKYKVLTYYTNQSTSPTHTTSCARSRSADSAPDGSGAAGAGLRRVSRRFPPLTAEHTGIPRCDVVLGIVDLIQPPVPIGGQGDGMWQGRKAQTDLVEACFGACGQETRRCGQTS